MSDPRFICRASPYDPETRKKRARISGGQMEPAPQGQSDPRFIAMGGDELLREFPEGASVAPYTEFARMEVLPVLPLFLLYELEPGFGHWVLLHEAVDRDGAPCLEFFDSYGLFPDHQQEWVPPAFRKISGQDAPHMLKLLARTHGELAYSPAKLQGKDPRIATCGRHCVMRAKMPNLSAETYGAALKAVARMLHTTPDHLVAEAVPPS